ncbi:MAG: FGGY family carbohydrate kinase [Candidatus Thorarchaeota archaeon]
MDQKSEYFLTIDAGTSGCKAGIGDIEGNIIKVVKTDWTYFSPEELAPYGAEFDPKDFWKKIIFTIKEVIKQSGIDSNLISCIAVTSQRHGCVFIDNKGEELYSAPNRDSRGLEVDIDEYIDTDELYQITGQNPPFLFTPARYLWFKENEEEVFDKIAMILPINSWIVYKLTNQSVIDITTAYSTQLIDLKQRDWSETILESISLSKEKLPEIIEIGTPIKSIKAEIIHELGINEDTLVTLSGADTQSAMVGTGARQSGDIIIVAGSTMPIVQISDSPIIDPDNNLWSGCFFDNDKWLIEANAGSPGIIKDWFVNTFLTQGVESNKNNHEKFDELAEKQKPGADDIITDLGIPIFNWKTLTEITSSTITFPSVMFSLDSFINLGSFCRSVLENIIFAIRANIELINKTTKIATHNVLIVGGLSKSNLLREILASVLNTNIYYLDSEGTIIGGFIACSIAKNYHSSYQDFIKSFQDKFQITTPNQEDFNVYEQFYRQWLDNYTKKREEVGNF